MEPVGSLQGRFLEPVQFLLASARPRQFESEPGVEVSARGAISAVQPDVIEAHHAVSMVGLRLPQYGHRHPIRVWPIGERIDLGHGEAHGHRHVAVDAKVSVAAASRKSCLWFAGSTPSSQPIHAEVELGSLTPRRIVVRLAISPPVAVLAADSDTLRPQAHLRSSRPDGYLSGTSGRCPGRVVRFVPLTGRLRDSPSEIYDVGVQATGPVPARDPALGIPGTAGAPNVWGGPRAHLLRSGSSVDFPTSGLKRPLGRRGRLPP